MPGLRESLGLVTVNLNERMKQPLPIRMIQWIAFALFPVIAWGQGIDAMKLPEKDVPAGYVSSAAMLCQSVQAASFYAQTDTYAGLLGKVTQKTYQSFASNGDQGPILYGEYAEDFQGERFLQGLLWGQKGKPTKAHPEEYRIQGKYLIIWSFAGDSVLKKVSQEKIRQHFN